MPSYDRQYVTLVSSILVSLSAGTNYVFSAYSPQLALRLQLSSTTLNAIGIAGNYGMYISSPFVGQVIDRIGPRRPLVVAATLLCLGYGIVWQVFRTHPGPTSDSGPLTTRPSTVAVLAFGMLCTGFGSSTALSSAVGGVARSFGPKNRATVLSLTFAGFGLAAFFWAGLSHALFGDDTASLLLLLSLGTGGLILVGAGGFRSPNTAENLDTPEHLVGDHFEPLEGSPSLSSPLRSAQHDTHSVEHPTHDRENHVDIYGRKLIKTLDFWLIWTLMGCCCGTALMIINNIGTIVATLHFQKYHLNSDSFDSRKIPSVAQLQSAQVSLLSVFNCLGRVFAGTVSDTLQIHYGLTRVWWLCWVAGLFIASQIIGLQFARTLPSVSFLTGLTGFAYGNMYGIGPALVLEWFGLDHFATNYGFLNLAPVATSQIFNLAFGQIYDRHHRQQKGDTGSPLCGLGPECYQDAFWITISACGLAMGLAGTLVYRHRFKDISHREGLNKSTEADTERTWMLRPTSPPS